MAPRLDFGGNKAGQLKACKGLASEITEKGALIYDLLGSEITLRDTRNSILSQAFEMEHLQRAVTRAIEGLMEQTARTQAGIENLAADEVNLKSKIDKKRAEWERANKRLKSLQGVRPAYMDEYEKVEGQLVKLYYSYMDKYRNLAWLEHQLEEFNRVESERFQETQTNLQNMQTRLREAELTILKGSVNPDAHGSGTSLVLGSLKRLKN
jgi:clusterin-associated protein 1